MPTCLTSAGEALITQKMAAGQKLVIDKFILANIPGQDPAAAVDRAEGKPAADKIVHEYVIPEEFKGYVNPNQVVYSMLLGSDLGNFSFNWFGLYSSADNVVVAITHLPTLQKIKTDLATNTTGNNLTRNMLLEFTGAQSATNITVEAKTWQVDFTARLNSIDERTRKVCRDIYGRARFIKDAAKVVNTSGTYSIQAGYAYLEGLRVDFAKANFAPGVLPRKVWIDAAMQQTGADKRVEAKVVCGAPAEAKADFTDSASNRHYLIPIAEINSSGVVTELRTVEPIDTDLVDYLKKKADALKDHNHDGRYAPAAHGHPEYAPTSHGHSGYAPTNHGHSIAQVTGLQAGLDSKVNRSDWVELVAGRAWRRPDGIIEQVGTATMNGSSLTISFPYTFPSHCINVKTTSNATAARHVTVTAKNKWNFTMLPDSGASYSLDWEAKGK